MQRILANSLQGSYLKYIDNVTSIPKQRIREMTCTVVFCVINVAVFMHSVCLKTSFSRTGMCNKESTECISRPSAGLLFVPSNRCCTVTTMSATTFQMLTSC
jgi:hypothetical protein